MRPGLCRFTVASLVCLALFSCGSPRELREFRTEDGVTIALDLHLPPRAEGPAPLVVLCHQLDRDRSSWAPLVPRLVERGYAVAALDHRGFGASRREVASPEELTDLHKHNMRLDVIGAVAAASRLRGVDASRIAIVGAGFSVDLAVQAAITNRNVRALVLLSGPIYRDAEDFLVLHPELPVLLVAAERHERTAFVMRQHAAKLTGPEQRYFEFPSGSNDPADWEGTDGLAGDTGLAEMILWFLERNFATRSSATAAAQN